MVLDFKYFPLIYFLLIGLELAVLSSISKRDFFNLRDTITNVLTGFIGVAITGALIKTFVVYVLFLVYQFSVLQLSFTFWSFIPCFILLDLLYYIGHAFTHKVNIGWAAHIVHHSSDKFNFSTAIRQGWTQHYLAVFYLPLVVIGFHPNVIISCYIISSAIQFFQHTQLVGQLPFIIELIFVTPAHHKIHHAQNPEYIDKNYGGVFIIWDRLFGSYAEEQGIAPIVFGEPFYKKSYNLLTINFRHYFNILQRVVAARSWKIRLGYIFLKPGWQPE